MFICVLLWLNTSSSLAQPKWDKKWLTAIFYAEGANFGDFNKDGKLDVVSGPFIYDGPDFKAPHAYTDVAVSDPLGYSQNFFSYVYDFDKDGFSDICVVGFPGKEAFWYRNPGPKADPMATWQRHVILDVVDNESPALINIVGDDAPELVCMSGGYAGYATPDAADPTKPWTFHKVTPQNKGYQRFTHGIGVGDVNGDGKLDLLEKAGWWEQPEKHDDNTPWKQHPFDFAPGTGSSQMFAYDVDGDGDNDVITALNAHGYGLAWYENIKGDDGKAITFKQHLILSPKADEKLNGVQFSQLHAVDLIDMDGDGIKDILTGKRYWAHGPHGDPDPSGTPYLYWFKLKRDTGTEKGGKVTYEPHQIDDTTGVGTQITAADANGDGIPDVIVGNKRGTILFLSKK